MINKRNEKPELVGWDITQRCNLSCPHCYSSATRSSKDELSTSECLKIVDSLIALGTRIICWTGGEPLLRDDLEEIAFHAKSKGNITSGVTTNGILLDEKRAKSLKQAGIDIVQISLDGSTPEKNRKIRRATEAEFWKIIDGIRFCRELDMALDLAMLLGEENLDDGADFIELTRDQGVKSVRFCGFVPAGRGAGERVKKRLLFSRKLPQLKRFVQQNVNGKDPVVMFDPAFGPLPPGYYFHQCISGVNSLYMSSTGDVYPCTSLISKEFLVGNVRDRSIEDLWNDPKMTFISSFPVERIKGFCRECQYFSRCRGACRGITFAHTHDLYASFPLCLKRVQSS